MNNKKGFAADSPDYITHDFSVNVMGVQWPGWLPMVLRERQAAAAAFRKEVMDHWEDGGVKAESKTRLATRVEAVLQVAFWVKGKSRKCK
ncbi:hypothetical protein HK101_006564, partial [Irineochytrium annulatum]